jgi:hypothetical protein
MELTIARAIVPTYPWRYATTIAAGILVATRNL